MVVRFRVGPTSSWLDVVPSSCLSCRSLVRLADSLCITASLLDRAAARSAGTECELLSSWPASTTSCCRAEEDWFELTDNSSAEDSGEWKLSLSDSCSLVGVESWRAAARLDWSRGMDCNSETSGSPTKLFGVSSRFSTSCED